MNKKNNKFFINLISAVAYIALSVAIYVGSNVKSGDLKDVLLLIIGLPLGMALADGLATGIHNKIFKENMLNILFSTLSFTAISIVTILLLKYNGIMEKAFKSNGSYGNFTISINENINIGLIAQYMMIVLVINALGNIIGTKASSVVKNLRS